MKTCTICGGMKRFHTDHAPGGFEICSHCNGTGKEPEHKRCPKHSHAGGVALELVAKCPDCKALK